jgi:hypothetical protein
VKTAFWILAVFCLSGGVITQTTWGASPWATGPALQEQLAESTNIIWVEVPLRQALESLARNKNVAILLDRRVDPDQKIDISLHQTRLRNILEAIAEKYNLGLSMVGPVAYFAPPEAARKVRTLVALRQDDIRRLTSGAVKKFFAQKPMAWDDFSQPRELLEKLGAENGVRITALEQIPHDLWAAADLPPLDLVERLTLLAGQYDLTFQVSADGSRVILLPAPEQVELARTYQVGRQAQTTAEKYASLAPRARIKIDGQRIIVTGTIEDHERISAPHDPAERDTVKPANPDFTQKRYELTVVEKPIGPLVEQLARQLNLELKIDRQAIDQAGISLDQRVSFSVKNATVDDLLRTALQKTGLKFIRRGKTLQIEPLQAK